MFRVCMVLKFKSVKITRSETLTNIFNAVKFPFRKPNHYVVRAFIVLESSVG